MKTFHYSTQAKKDLKRYRGNRAKMVHLYRILDMLQHNIPIPAEYKPHRLIGQYKGCMECHVEEDFLLIWIEPDTDVIEIIRIGSHSELFG